jgi:hypothetical protein
MRAHKNYKKFYYPALVVLLSSYLLQLASASEKHIANRAQTYYQAIMKAGQLCPGSFDKRLYLLLGERDEGWKFHKGELQIPDNYLNCLVQGICQHKGVRERRQAEKAWGSTLNACKSNSSPNEYDFPMESVSESDTAAVSSSEDELDIFEHDKSIPALISIDATNILWLLFGILTGSILAYSYLSKVSSTYSNPLKVRRPEL